MEKVKKMLERGRKLAQWQLTPARVKAAKLDSIFETLRAIPETRQLLDMAHMHGVPITFDAQLAFSGMDAYFERNHKTGARRIVLSPFSNTVPFALAHELRHMWQDLVLAMPPESDMQPLDRLFYVRVCEADAMAFEIFILERLRDFNEDVIDMTRRIEAHKAANGGVLDESFLLSFDAKNKRDPEKYVQALREGFAQALQSLEKYDQGVARKVYRRHVALLPNLHRTDESAQAHFKELVRIDRNAMQAMTASYLGQMSAQGFTKRIFKDANPQALTHVRLVDSFTRAAKKKGADIKALRMDVVAKAQNIIK